MPGYKGAAVRVADGKIGLCTSTYNHSQDNATKAEIALALKGMASNEQR